MIYSILGLLPWYWWAGGILALVVVTYLGLWAPLIAILRRIPWQAWAALAVVVAFFGWLHVHDEAIGDEVRAERNAYWKGEQEKMLQEAADRLAKAIEAAREQERKLEAELASLMSKFRKEIANVQAQRDRDVAAARSGALRLRLPASVCADSLAYGPPAPGSPGSDGSSGTYLPQQITSDLFSLANDADAVVAQLTACQAIVKADRSLQ